MVAQPRTSSDAIAALQAIEERPYEFDFFAVLRLIENLHADKPRLGEAARPVDEPIRLTQDPSLAFAPSTLASFRAGSGGEPHRLSEYFFGLFGPHGPLPLHLTEYARDREHHENDPTFRRFADIFHHRLLLFFYRAWASANPVTSLDRPHTSRFDSYVGSIFGIGAGELRNRDAVPDWAKLHLAGLLALKTRPAGALVSILDVFMGLRFRVREFVGGWMKLPHGDWAMLGSRQGASTLGGDVVLGGSVWTCQNRFRLICGPLPFAAFRRLLPGRDSLVKLRDLVRNYLGDEFDWDLNLVLQAHEVPSLRLGVSGELGWTTWLGQRRSAADADDVIVNPRATQRRPRFRQ
jgi:type VI secretion system protein ImpH